MVLVGRLGAYLYAPKIFGQPPGFWRVKGSVLSYMRERRVPLFLRNLADNKFARHRRSFSREQHRQSSSTILTKPNDDWTPHGKRLSGATTLRFLSAWTAYLRPAIDMAKAGMRKSYAVTSINQLYVSSPGTMLDVKQYVKPDWFPLSRGMFSFPPFLFAALYIRRCQVRSKRGRQS